MIDFNIAKGILRSVGIRGKIAGAKGAEAVNAADQANSFEKVSKIATIVNRVKLAFPDVSVDLKPWLKNAETAKFEDPDSIDISFHFSRPSFACRSQTILMQVHVSDCHTNLDQRVLQIRLSGHDELGQQWHFSTAQSWSFVGSAPPDQSTKEHFCQICADIFRVFEFS